jgi:hypothetical protein
LALVAALPVALVVQPRASAQEPELEVFYTKLEPREQFKYKWKGKEAVCTAGVFRWEVPQREFGTQGLDRNFTGYCAEVLVPITADKLYRFQMNSIFAMENYGVVGRDNGATIAQRRGMLIKELFGRHFRDPVLKAVNAEEAIAFQIALWEIIQETEPADGKAKLDLFAGDFQANYAKADAPAFVTTAQKYLDSLTGTDEAQGLFYENPDLRGRELIRLKGIKNADGVVAQSQYALKYVGGGGTGTIGPSRALTAIGGGTVGGGFGAPSGGVGSGGGGGGFVSGGGNGGGRTFPTTPTTPTTPPTTTTTPPPVGAPPSNPPPQNPNNPVPAPAGLLLGAIALGAVGSWRLGARYLRAK